MPQASLSSRPSVHTSKLTAQLDNIGERKTVTDDTIADLFNTVDKGGDGTISQHEFAKVYRMINEKVAEEHKAARTADEKLFRVQRRSKFLCAIMSFLIPVMVILLMGTYGLVYQVVQMTKESHVTDAQLVDGNGKTVETGEAIEHADLLLLTQKGDLDQLNRLIYLNVPDVRAMKNQLLASGGTPPTMSQPSIPIRKVIIDSFLYTNATSVRDARLEIYGTDGSKLLVSDGSMAVKGPPDGYAAFDGAGVGWATDATTNLASLVEQCSKFNCPLPACATRTYLGANVEMTCGGSTMWAWPEGMDLPTRGSNQRGLDNSACWRACRTAYLSDYDTMGFQKAHAKWNKCTDPCARAAIKAAEIKAAQKK
jgi:hypothetical protein